MLVESYMEGPTPVTDETLGRVQGILDAFPARQAGAGAAPLNQEDLRAGELPPPMRECSRLAGEAIKWCRKAGGTRGAAAAAGLHRWLADYLWRSLSWEGLGVVSVHYARANSGAALGAALATCAKRGSRDEEDLFLARGALQLLAMAKRAQASTRGCSHDPSPAPSPLRPLSCGRPPPRLRSGLGPAGSCWALSARRSAGSRTGPWATSWTSCLMP